MKDLDRTSRHRHRRRERYRQGDLTGVGEGWLLRRGRCPLCGSTGRDGEADLALGFQGDLSQPPMSPIHQPLREWCVRSKSPWDL